MDTILLLTDFSDNALHAAQYACTIARQLGYQRIVLHHAYEVMVPVAPGIAIGQVNNSIESTYDPEYDRIMREANLKTLEELKAGLAHFAGEDLTLECSTSSLDLANGTADAIENYGASLVMMGVTGTDGLDRMLLGSNAARVMESAVCPVLLVPLEAPIQPVRRITLACDLRHIDETIPLAELEEILDGFQAPLTVLKVGEVKPEDQAGADFLHMLLERYQPTFDLVENKDTVNGIMEHASLQTTSMVIVIQRKHGFFRDLFHKSVTNKLADQTRIPLLVLHEKKA